MQNHQHMWRTLGLTGDRTYCGCGAVREPNGEGGYSITAPLRSAPRAVHTPADPDGIVLQEESYRYNAETNAWEVDA